MTALYQQLWKLLIDKDMKKKDLAAAAGISKMGKGENNTTDALGKICMALHCPPMKSWSQFPMNRIILTLAEE